MKILVRAGLLALILATALASAACDTAVGVGVSVAPGGGWYGPYGGGVMVGGGPVFYR